jgi:hypothetical protein
MSQYPSVKLEASSVATNKFRAGSQRWSVPALIEYAKELPVFDLPLCCVDLSRTIWDPIETPKRFAEHMQRVINADTSAPVILDEDGFIMDGWHRIVRALVDGNATIPAVRFDVTPPPTWVEDVD